MTRATDSTCGSLGRGDLPMKLPRITIIASDDKPMYIMVPASPGGGWDRTARTMQGALSYVTNRIVQVYNVPGAGGTLGVAFYGLVG